MAMPGLTSISDSRMRTSSSCCRLTTTCWHRSAASIRELSVAKKFCACSAIHPMLCPVMNYSIKSVMWLGRASLLTRRTRWNVCSLDFAASILSRSCRSDSCSSWSCLSVEPKIAWKRCSYVSRGSSWSMSIFKIIHESWEVRLVGIRILCR